MPRAVSALRFSLLIGAFSCGGSPVEVIGVRPARADIESALITNGRIEVASGTAVHVESSGRVEQLLVQRGDSIRQGQVMLRLEDSGQADARARALARLDAARARLAVLDAGLPPQRVATLRAELARLEAGRASASEDRDRLARLTESRAATRAELRGATRALAEADLEIEAVKTQLSAPVQGARRQELLAAVREEEAALRLADREATNLVVRTPSTGTVYSLHARPGDFLLKGDLVARIGSLETVRARILVDEPELGRVALGDIARLTADAYPGREWACPVERLANEVVELGARRIGEVLCTSENPDGKLLPNLAVGVRIVTGRAASALSVPREAVRRAGADGSFLWVEVAGRAIRRPVDLGVIGPVFAEVKSGVSESDTVLLPGQGSIAEGRRVKVLEGADRGAR